jgi:hypothetical protein
VAAAVAVCALGVVLASRSAAAGRASKEQPSAAALQTTVPSRTAGSSSVPPAAAVDTGRDPGSLTGWRDVVAALYSRRAAVFATPAADGGLHAFGGVYVPDSTEQAADETQIRALAQAGEMLRGFTPTVVAVTRATLTGDRAELLLSDRWTRYDVVPAGQDRAMPLRTGAARPPTSVRMVLRRTAAGWRIAEAERLS